MRVLFTLIVAAIAFAAGVWYMGGFEETPPAIVSPTPIDSTPTPPAQATYVNASTNMIQVTTPTPGATVPSVFAVAGKARGGWYFEANFPYEIQDANGNTIAQGPVQAQGEWMTTEFVPFTRQITVPNYKGKAMLILHNDNPSGLPENAASVSIPITIQ